MGLDRRVERLGPQATFQDRFLGKTAVISGPSWSGPTLRGHRFLASPCDGRDPCLVDSIGPRKCLRSRRLGCLLHGCDEAPRNHSRRPNGGSRFRRSKFIDGLPTTFTESDSSGAAGRRRSVTCLQCGSLAELDRVEERLRAHDSFRARRKIHETERFELVHGHDPDRLSLTFLAYEVGTTMSLDD